MLMNKGVTGFIGNILRAFYGDISGLVKNSQSAYNAFIGNLAPSNHELTRIIT